MSIHTKIGYTRLTGSPGPHNSPAPLARTPRGNDCSFLHASRHLQKSLGCQAPNVEGTAAAAMLPGWTRME